MHGCLLCGSAALAVYASASSRSERLAQRQRQFSAGRQGLGAGQSALPRTGVGAVPWGWLAGGGGEHMPREGASDAAQRGARWSGY